MTANPEVKHRGVEKSPTLAEITLLTLALAREVVGTHPIAETTPEDGVILDELSDRVRHQLRITQDFSDEMLRAELQS